MLTTIAFLAMTADARPEPGCAAASRDIATGEHLSADLVTPVVCRAEARPVARLRFDPVSHSTIAAEAVPAGTYLGRLLVPDAPIVAKGARITLRATSGPTIVERQVTTLQPGKSGQQVFVRDDSGNVFAVALVVDRASVAR